MAGIKIKRNSRKVKAPVAAAPEVSASSTVRESASRFTHDLEFAYSGDSPVTTSRRSKTPLRIEEFGSAPDMVLTDRDNAAMGPLRQKYGKKAFARGDLDVGIANRLIRKGMLKYVSGEVRDERCVLAFVK